MDNQRIGCSNNDVPTVDPDIPQESSVFNLYHEQIWQCGKEIYQLEETIEQDISLLNDNEKEYLSQWNKLYLKKKIFDRCTTILDQWNEDLTRWQEMAKDSNDEKLWQQASHDLKQARKKHNLQFHIFNENFDDYNKKLSTSYPEIKSIREKIIKHDTAAHQLEQDVRQYSEQMKIDLVESNISYDKDETMLYMKAKLFRLYAISKLSDHPFNENAREAIISLEKELSKRDKIDKILFHLKEELNDFFNKKVSKCFRFRAGTPDEKTREELIKNSENIYGLNEFIGGMLLERFSELLLCFEEIQSHEAKRETDFYDKFVKSLLDEKLYHEDQEPYLRLVLAEIEKKRKALAESGNFLST